MKSSILAEMFTALATAFAAGACWNAGDMRCALCFGAMTFAVLLLMAWEVKDDDTG